MGSRQAENYITRFKVFYNVNEIPPGPSAASAKNLSPNFRIPYSEYHFSVTTTFSSATAKCVFTEQTAVATKAARFLLNNIHGAFSENIYYISDHTIRSTAKSQAKMLNKKHIRLMKFI